MGSLNESATFAGDIYGLDPVDVVSVEKVGTGTLTLTGVNAYTGTTRITAGTLQVGDGGANGLLGMGAVLNNATLSFNRNDTMIFGNAISGWGDLVHDGTGTTILTGTNTYAGTTTINAGTLQVGNGGEGGTLGLSGVVNNGSLVFNRSDGNIIGNAISGTGSVTINGFTELWGVNSYSGGTFINSYLSVNADAAMGSAAGALIFDSGVLNTTGSFTSARPITAGGAATFVPALGTVLTLTGVISGTGVVGVNGPGTLVLAGVNTYSGDTILNGGTTRIAAASALGTGDTLFLNEGTLQTTGSLTLEQLVVFQSQDSSLTPDAGTTLTLSGSVGGQTLTMGGGGALVLTGTNSYGTTAVNSGTLRIGNGGTVGTLGAGTATIASGATLEFARSNNFAVSNTIAGSGVLTKNGAGRMTLTGDSSGFAGTTTVTAGRLHVDGALGGSMTVGAGGALSGSGEVGAVNISGTGGLAGQSGQTLSLQSLSLGSDATVTVNLGAPSTEALFDVAGNLTLGGTLDIIDAGSFRAGVYRLFNIGGVLTDNGLVIGSTPAEVSLDDLGLQIMAGQINLLSSAGVELRFWDGGNAALRDNGVIDGGAGTWTATSPTWTDAGGAVNGPVQPNPAFVVFQGNGAAVTLDDSAGALAATGLQFVANGYSLVGDGLELAGTSGRTEIRVGDGSGDDDTKTAHIGSSLTSGGDLLKTGAGTLLLSGDNDYANTIVESGTLYGTTASINGTISNAGTVGFIEDEDASFAGSITGLDGIDGLMVKRGAGALTLGGASSLDWDIEAGSLVTTTQGFTGDAAIAGGATLLFDQSEAGRYAGTLSGTGTLAVAGGHGVELTGSNAGFAGTIDLRGGTLIVNGALGGALIIGDGSTLGGGGTLGSVSVAAGGTIAPGNSIGTLNVGDISFAPGSVYAVEVDALGSGSDLIAASGRATLNGGSVVHIGLDGDYRPSSTYTILTAAGGIDGQFGDVTSDFAFLTPSLGYSANAVTLTLARNDADFAAVGRTANQRATAGGVEVLGFASPLYDAVVGLGADEARTAFDLLSGEIHASFQSVLMNDSRFIRTAALDRMRLAGAAQDSTRGVTWWTQGIGNWGHVDGDGNAYRITHSAKGVLMGVDAIAAEAFQFGLYGGWQRTDADVKHVASAAKIDSYHLGFYAGMDGDHLSLRSGLSYSWHDADITRRITFGDFEEVVQSQRGASTAQGFAEVGYRAQFGSLEVEPFAGITHVSQHSEAGNERGGDAAQRISSTSMNTTFTTLGGRITQSFALLGITADLRAMAGWSHAFGDRTPLARVAFAQADPFTIRGAPIAKDALTVDAGLGLALSSRARLDVAYGGDIASTAENHSARATFSLAF